MPDSLPAQPDIAWSKDLPSNGLGGISANAELVVIGGRDVLDRKDQFRCYSAATGELLWQVEYEAEGLLDYGNSPRAAPFIHETVVYLQGAFGTLKCVDLETGAEFWSVNLIDRFKSEVLTWGMCWSPLLVDGKLIVQPGSEQAALAALDPDTGETIWTVKGRRAAYSSPIVATFSGVRQIIAYDQTSLGGWDIESGKRLWTLKPENDNDFNVPTPIQVGEQLFVATENNGARLYQFDKQGLIVKKPVSHFEDLAPDTHSPIVVGDRVFGISNALFCLSSRDLSEVWIKEDDAYSQYGSIVGSDRRALVTTLDGQMILLDLTAKQYVELSRMKLSADENVEVHSHPAFVGKNAYIRVGKTLLKLKFD